MYVELSINLGLKRKQRYHTASWGGVEVGGGGGEGVEQQQQQQKRADVIFKYEQIMGKLGFEVIMLCQDHVSVSMPHLH